MKVKKLMAMMTACVLAAGMLAGCGSDTQSSQEDSQEQTAQEEPQDEAEDTSAVAAGSGNVLVVYYSATGNTEEAANMIADAAGGDLFELEPADPYTDEDLDWTNDDSRVTQEYENEDQRDVELVSTTVDNWDSYDTVFIGYPKIQYGFLSV